MIELMVTIAVLSIIMAIAFPAVRSMIANSAQATSINKFIGYLNYARVEATKRGSQVVICASTDGAACAGTSWETGWIVYVDSNGDGVKGAGEPLLKSHEAVGGTLTVRASGAGSGKVAFNSRGIPTSSKTFTFCDVRGNGSARGIVVSNSGRVRRGAPNACP